MLNRIEGGKEYGRKAYKMNTQYFKSGKFGEAYAAWKEIANQMIGYPSFGEWLYMTDQELQEWLNPKAAKVKACKEWGKCEYSKQIIEEEGIGSTEEEQEDGCDNQGLNDGSTQCA